LWGAELAEAGAAGAATLKSAIAIVSRIRRMLFSLSDTTRARQSARRPHVRNEAWFVL
jgi:hypothetical protein